MNGFMVSFRIFLGVLREHLEIGTTASLQFSVNAAIEWPALLLVV
jgi:hypothetical protein